MAARENWRESGAESAEILNCFTFGLTYELIVRPTIRTAPRMKRAESLPVNRQPGCHGQM